MLLRLPQLKELAAKLDAARLGSDGPGNGLYCERPNTDAEGNTERWEPKPKAAKPIGHVYPDGTMLLELDGVKGVRVPLGPHGRAHLAIDPATGEVKCAACEGKA